MLKERQREEKFFDNSIEIGILIKNKTFYFDKINHKKQNLFL